MRGQMQTLHEALASMKAKSPLAVKGQDWRAALPPGSRWMPGDPGKPSCQMCKGTGYVSLDVGVNSPHFGKLFVCDCVQPATAQRLNENIERQFYTR